MLTSVAPAITRSLSGAFTPAQINGFLSSVAACDVPLQHRAGVSIGNQALQTKNGLATSPGWRPSDYPDLFPDASKREGDIEAPSGGGYRAGDWYSTFYGAPYFDLTTSLQQQINQYYAQNYYQGDSLSVTGPSSITNLTSNTINAQNINAQTFNGASTDPPPAGPQGNRGLDGLPGPPGEPGAVFLIEGGRMPGDGGNPDEVARWAMWLAAKLRVEVTALRQLLSRLRVRIRPHRVVTSVTFDPDTCKVKVKKDPALTGTLFLSPS